jgi:DNA-binding NarL/FixJ family response regulator
MNRYRVIIADDHAMFRHGMKRILSERPDVEVVGEAQNGLDLLDQLRTLQPDMIVLDISMPQLRGIEAIHEIKKTRPDAKVLMLTMHKDSDYVFQAISAGADGYLLKEDAEKDLFFAMDTVRRGKVYLSSLVAEESHQDWVEMRRGTRQPADLERLTLRERQILKLIAEGKSSKEIGSLLFISFRTVERHRANIMDKLNVRKSAELIRYALQKGYS